MEAVGEAARVITTDFFRLLLRPAWLLQDVRAQPEIATATLLLKGVSASSGAGLGAGTAMEEKPELIKTALTTLEESRDSSGSPASESHGQDNPDILTAGLVWFDIAIGRG